MSGAGKGLNSSSGTALHDRARDALIGIWTDLLRTEVSSDDNFFDIGGYSLLVVKVANAAKKAGLSITADDIFHHPTIDELASIASRDFKESSLSKNLLAPPFDFSTVYSKGAHRPIGENGKLVRQLAPGAGAPVFFIPWGSGNIDFVPVDSIRELVASPLYGLEGIGVSTRHVPPVSIIELASIYVDEIDTVLGDGPLLLVGICSGAHVAYEVSRIALERGRQYAWIGVVNSLMPGISRFDRAWGPADFYNYRVHSIMRSFDLDALDEHSIALANERLKRIGWVEGGSAAEEFLWQQVVWASTAFAQEHYLPVSYQANGELFQLSRYKDFLDVDWGGLMPGAELSIHAAEDSIEILRSELFRTRLEAAIRESSLR